MYLQVGILDVNRAWPLPPNQFALLLWRKKKTLAKSCIELWGFSLLFLHKMKSRLCLQTALSEESKSSWWLQWICFPLAIKLHDVSNPDKILTFLLWDGFKIIFPFCDLFTLRRGACLKARKAYLLFLTSVCTHLLVPSNPNGLNKKEYPSAPLF